MTVQGTRWLSATWREGNREAALIPFRVHVRQKSNPWLRRGIARGALDLEEVPWPQGFLGASRNDPRCRTWGHTQRAQ